jgi:hypothetical protein
MMRYLLQLIQLRNMKGSSRRSGGCELCVHVLSVAGFRIFLSNKYLIIKNVWCDVRNRRKYNILSFLSWMSLKVAKVLEEFDSPVSQCARRAIAKVKQRWSVIRWVTKNGLCSVLRKARRWSRLHLLSLAPTNPHRGGMARSPYVWPIKKAFALAVGWSWWWWKRLHPRQTTIRRRRAVTSTIFLIAKILVKRGFLRRIYEMPLLPLNTCHVR